MHKVLAKLDELIGELESVKRPTQDMEVGLFIIELKFKKIEFERLNNER